jgi:hypothetical protein
LFPPPSSRWNMGCRRSAYSLLALSFFIRPICDEWWRRLPPPPCHDLAVLRQCVAGLRRRTARGRPPSPCPLPTISPSWITHPAPTSSRWVEEGASRQRRSAIEAIDMGRGTVVEMEMALWWWPWWEHWQPAQYYEFTAWAPIWRCHLLFRSYFQDVNFPFYGFRYSLNLEYYLLIGSWLMKFMFEQYAAECSFVIVISIVRETKDSNHVKLWTTMDIGHLPGISFSLWWEIIISI